ncbi:hypothetical protein Tco_0794530 [Tanacetum coccineum]
MLYRRVGRRSEAKNEFEIDVRRSDLGLRKGCWWYMIRCPKQRNGVNIKNVVWLGPTRVKELDMVSYCDSKRIRWCGFRLSNRWLSMKKDVASCGSKYLAYSRVEIEYQGSSEDIANNLSFPSRSGERKLRIYGCQVTEV